MPSKDDHLIQARHNTQFYESVMRPTYNDWAATVLFYIGLHYIDAFLAIHGHHPGSHDVRDKFIRQLQELRGIANDYYRLKNGSRNARYYPPTNYPDQYIQELEQVHLNRVRSALAQFFTNQTG